jgi:pyruvate,water dikinase
MCEVPSNVILAHEFAEIFDGFSIGSNDLTQLTLGVDRDSELLAPLFDERNEAVTSLIASVIKAAHKHDMPIGICGQAPSDYPDFAAFLVHQGIDSISLNPDVAVKMRREIVKIEKTIEVLGELSEEHPHVRMTGHRKLRGRHRWKAFAPFSSSHPRMGSTH